MRQIVLAAATVATLFAGEAKRVATVAAANTICLISLSIFYV